MEKTYIRDMLPELWDIYKSRVHYGCYSVCVSHIYNEKLFYFGSGLSMKEALEHAASWIKKDT